MDTYHSVLKEFLQEIRDILAHNTDEQIMLDLVKQQGIIPPNILENIPIGELRNYLKRLEQVLIHNETEQTKMCVGATGFVFGLLPIFPVMIMGACSLPKDSKYFQEVLHTLYIKALATPFTGPSEGTGGSDTNGEQNKPVGKTDE